MNKRPYVHLYIDVLDKMPMLSHGSNAAVYFTVGALQEADVAAVAQYTGLNRKTIETTLDTLQTLGLVTQSNHGKYTAENYIENKSKEKKIFSDTLSINRSLSNQNQSVTPSKAVRTELDESFGTALQALSRVLLSYGGLNALEMQDFAELWEDYPDAARHQAALDVMLERATKPNYRYYASCVRNGANVRTQTAYPTRQERVTRQKETPVIEVEL